MEVEYIGKKEQSSENPVIRTEKISEDEYKVLQLLREKRMTAEEISHKAGISPEYIRTILGNLMDKGILAWDALDDKYGIRTITLRFILPDGRVAELPSPVTIVEHSSRSSKGEKMEDLLNAFTKAYAELEIEMKRYEKSVLDFKEKGIKTLIDSYKTAYKANRVWSKIILNPKKYLGRELTEKEKEDIYKHLHRTSTETEKYLEDASRLYSKFKVLKEYGWEQHYAEGKYTGLCVLGATILGCLGLGYLLGGLGSEGEYV